MVSLNEELDQYKRLLKSENVTNYRSAAVSDVIQTIGSDRNPYSSQTGVLPKAVKVTDLPSLAEFHRKN